MKAMKVVNTICSICGGVTAAGVGICLSGIGICAYKVGKAAEKLGKSAEKIDWNEVLKATEKKDEVVAEQ